LRKGFILRPEKKKGMKLRKSRLTCISRGEKDTKEMRPRPGGRGTREPFKGGGIRRDAVRFMRKGRKRSGCSRDQGLGVKSKQEETFSGRQKKRDELNVVVRGGRGARRQRKGNQRGGGGGYKETHAGGKRGRKGAHDDVVLDINKKKRRAGRPPQKRSVRGKGGGGSPSAVRKRSKSRRSGPRGQVGHERKP